MKHLLAVLLCAGCIANASAQNNCCGNGVKKQIIGEVELSAVNSFRTSERTMHSLEAGLNIFVTKHFGLCGTMGFGTTHSLHQYENSWNVAWGACCKADWQRAVLKLQYGRFNSRGDAKDSRYYDLRISAAPRCLSVGKADIQLGIGVRRFAIHTPESIYPHTAVYLSAGLSF